MRLIRMKSTAMEPTVHIQGTQTCSRLRIPYLERPVSRGRHDIITCWTERTPYHLTRMSAQREPLLSCISIPYFEHLVIGRRHDEVSCRADRTSKYMIRMATQGKPLFP